MCKWFKFNIIIVISAYIANFVTAPVKSTIVKPAASVVAMTTAASSPQFVGALASSLPSSRSVGEPVEQEPSLPPDEIVGRAVEESDILTVFCEDEIADLAEGDSIFCNERPTPAVSPEIEIIAVTKAIDR